MALQWTEVRWDSSGWDESGGRRWHLERVEVNGAGLGWDGSLGGVRCGEGEVR